MRLEWQCWQFYIRERQIKEIEASFEASKLRPVHATNKNLEPVEVMPLLPDFDRYEISWCFYVFAFIFFLGSRACRKS